MRVTRALMECLVFAATTTFAFGQSLESETEPQLGPIVPLSSNAFPEETAAIAFSEPQLGPIIPIAGTFSTEEDKSAPSPLTFPKDEVQYYPGAEAMPNLHFGFVPIRVIGHPMAASTIEPNPIGYSPSSPGPIHPDQIQFHLTALADQLAAAGLTNEAKRIQEFQQKFQCDHYQRLLIAHKESQIRSLQAEIASLRQTAADDARISVKVRVVELNHDGLNTLRTKLNGPVLLVHGSEIFSPNAEDKPHLSLQDVESDRIGELIELLSKTGNAKIVAEPSGTVRDSQNIRFLSSNSQTGGTTFVDSVAPGLSTVGHGGLTASFIATPKVIGFSKVRLGLVVESSNFILSGIGQANITGPSTKRLEHIAEISTGHTLAIISKPYTRQDDKNESDDWTSTIVLITPEILHGSTPSYSNEPIPSPVPSESSRRVFEAKVINENEE